MKHISSEERISGFEHRAPNKKHVSVDLDDVSECLFEMNENGKNYYIYVYIYYEWPDYVNRPKLE